MWVKIFDQRPLNKTYLPRKWTWRCLLRCLNEVVGRWHRRDLFVGDPNEHTMGIKVEAWVTCDRQFGRAPPSHTLQSKNTSRSANVNLFFGRRGSTPTKVRWRSAQKPRHDKCKRDFYSWGDADWRFPKKKKLYPVLRMTGNIEWTEWPFWSFILHWNGARLRFVRIGYPRFSLLMAARETKGLRISIQFLLCQRPAFSYFYPTLFHKQYYINFLRNIFIVFD